MKNLLEKTNRSPLKFVLIVIAIIVILISAVIFYGLVVSPRIYFENQKNEFTQVIEQKCREYGIEVYDICFSTDDKPNFGTGVIEANISVSYSVSADFNKTVYLLRDLNKLFMLKPILINKGDTYTIFGVNDAVLLKNDQPVFVYMDDEDKDFYKSLSEKFPYVGMSDKAIGATCLGLPTKAKRSVGGAYYEWSREGQMIAFVYASYPTSPYDYSQRRITEVYIPGQEEKEESGGTSSSSYNPVESKDKDKSSSENNREYYDFDDFYDEYYYDFFDIEDAYDYYINEYC